MNVRPGPTADSAILVPTDALAEVWIHGLGPDEAAACFGQSKRPHPWNVDRIIQVTRPGDGPESAARERVESPSRYTGEFEDGSVELTAGSGATVRVTTADQDPVLPMPQSLMLAIGHQWARAGRMSLHAASFRLDGRSILVLGDSEAGKSTLTLAALTLGAELLSDDWLLIHERDGEPVCSSLRSSMLLRSTPPTIDLLHRLPSAETASSAQEAKLWLHRDTNDQAPHCLPCDAVIHLRNAEVRPANTTLAPISPLEAYTHLLGGTSAVLFSSRLADESRRMHGLARALTRRPWFGTTTGHDLIARPEAVWASILDEVNAAAVRGDSGP